MRKPDAGVECARVPARIESSGLRRSCCITWAFVASTDSPADALQHAACTTGGAAGLLVGTGHAPPSAAPAATSRGPSPTPSPVSGALSTVDVHRQSAGVRAERHDERIHAYLDQFGRALAINSSGSSPRTDEEIRRNLIASEYPHGLPPRLTVLRPAARSPCPASSGGGHRRRETRHGSRWHLHLRRATPQGRRGRRAARTAPGWASSGTADFTARTHRARCRAPRSPARGGARRHHHVFDAVESHRGLRYLSQLERGGLTAVVAPGPQRLPRWSRTCSAVRRRTGCTSERPWWPVRFSAVQPGESSRMRHPPRCAGRRTSADR